MRKYEDTYKHKGMRHQLVVQLRDKGITDGNVLHAIEHIPRHFFLDSAFEKIAYEDRAFPIVRDKQFLTLHSRLSNATIKCKTKR